MDEEEQKLLTRVDESLNGTGGVHDRMDDVEDRIDYRVEEAKAETRTVREKVEQLNEQVDKNTQRSKRNSMVLSAYTGGTAILAGAFAKSINFMTFWK